MDALYSNKILILDFGSQYTQLIARRVREAQVYCEIHAFDMSAQAIRGFCPTAIILSGGPESAVPDHRIKADDIVFQLGVPVLGICYGMQTMAVELGGEVHSSEVREFGHARIRMHGHSTLLADIQGQTNDKGHGLIDVWMSHGDKVTALPDGFKIIASTEYTPIAGMADEARRFYGLQFHPEVTHTHQGGAILNHFLYDIAHCKPLWSIGNIAQELISSLREKIDDKRVLLALSGGVDSSVVAALLHAAIGDRLICVLVDNGLLRANESREVCSMFAEHIGLQVNCVDATAQFFKVLEGVADAEEKRRIIGNTFIDVFAKEAATLEDIGWFAQGTIYPDVVESANAKTGKAQLIKTHHNVGGLPEIMPFKLLEPLRELFKDEVRALGLELGLPKKMIFRHPFPGPGLAVRVIGEVQRDYVELLRKADAIYMDALHEAGLYEKISQAFAVFLPVRSVGVMGDARRYDYVIALRAVETVDFMTARCVHLPYDFLTEVANRIINEVEGISRVTYDISSKPPATIEWE